MQLLRLIFSDEFGNEREVVVDQDRFVIGRHSATDLSIADPRLSREHLYIERLSGSYFVEDKGSSNGSRLNGTEIFEPVEIRSGDVLDLGGGVIIRTELFADRERVTTGSFAKPVAAERSGIVSESGATSPHPHAKSASGGFPTSLLLIGPLVAVIVLVFAGGLFFVLNGGSSSNNQVTTDDGDDPIEIDDEPVNRDRRIRSNDVTSTSKPESSPTAAPSNLSSGNSESVMPRGTSETSKVEEHGAAFLRRIAINDPKAFLTGEQAARVNSKIKQISSSSALAANINSAKRSSSQLAALAQSKNLKPQFLAVAAIARLGSNKGDVVQTAQSLVDVLDKLGTQIGNELADDALLMIAAYDQGKAGELMKMRNMLQDLSNKFPESSRSIRTIWFLQKNGKLTNAEFENALTFLAVGIIAQNPKDFGVTAETLVL